MTTRSSNIDIANAEIVAKAGDIIPKSVKYAQQPKVENKIGDVGSPSGQRPVQEEVQVRQTPDLDPDDRGNLSVLEKAACEVFYAQGKKGQNVDNLVVYGGVPEELKIRRAKIEAPEDSKADTEAYIARLRTKHKLSEQQENTIRTQLRMGLLKKRSDV